MAVALTKIDRATWPRREHYENFADRSPCLWSMTAQIDVTALAEALRRSERKTYIAQIWMLATAVNRHPEFRMALDADGDPAVWDVVHPFFTVFNPTAETFSTVWSEYHHDFDTFHARTLPLLTRYRESTAYIPQHDVPPNTFDVSSLPWTSFTSFELQLRDAWTYLAPILTIGRYAQRAGEVLMPLAVQANHSVIDGFHVGRLLSDITALAADPTWVQTST